MLPLGCNVLLDRFAITLQMKDFVFVSMMCVFLFNRVLCPNHMLQESKVLQLFFAMTSVVSVGLSVWPLASDYFSEREKTTTGNLALNAFYVMALANALLNLALIALYVGLPFRTSSHNMKGVVYIVEDVY